MPSNSVLIRCLDFRMWRMIRGSFSSCTAPTAPVSSLIRRPWPQLTVPVSIVASFTQGMPNIVGRDAAP